MTDTNKELVRRYVELWSTGNLALADEVLSPDFIDHAHPNFAPGPEAVKQAVSEFRASFPDALITIEQMVCEGDMVAFHAVIRATHQADYAGYAPTGKITELRVMDFVRISDGKMVELWTCQDALGWLLQLGGKVQ